MSGLDDYVSYSGWLRNRWVLRPDGRFVDDVTLVMEIIAPALKSLL